jgi:hypothetical protein
MSGEPSLVSTPLFLRIFAVLVLSVFAAAGSGCDRGEGCPGDDGSCLHPKRMEGKYGYVDASGKIVIAPRFDGADAFSEGLAVVLDSGRFGYIDPRGTLAIPAVYRHARPFRDGYAPVRRDGSWQFIDRGGNIVAARGAAPD